MLEQRCIGLVIAVIVGANARDHGKAAVGQRLGDELRERLARGLGGQRVKLLGLVDVEKNAARRRQREFLLEAVEGCLDDVAQLRLAVAEQLGPAIAASDAVGVGHVAEPEVHEGGHQRLDRIVARPHGDGRPLAAFAQRAGPWRARWHDLPPQGREHARLHQRGLANARIADQRHDAVHGRGEQVQRGRRLVFAAEEEVGVLLAQGFEAAIGVDAQPELLLARQRRSRLSARRRFPRDAARGRGPPP